MIKTITIICPVFNEEENVQIFYDTFNNLLKNIDTYNFKFLFLDNRSTDKTYSILKEIADRDNRVTILRYSKNFGVMKSIYTGILHSNTDCSVVFDSDLQDPPELLLEFINEWENDVKIVYGKRIKRVEPKHLTIFRNMFKFMQKKLDNTVNIESGAWLIDKRVIEELRKKDTYEPYLPGLLSSVGFKTVGVPYERRVRVHGESKFNLNKYFLYATDGLVSGSIVPLRISIWVGILTSIFSVILGTYFVLAKFYWNFSFASGVAADITISLFFWGIHFIIIGIIGEYIGRIYLKDDENQRAIIDIEYNKNEGYKK